MSHKQNLIPGGHKLTPEELSRGGINGARSRKEKKQVQELARAILDMPLHDGFIIDAEDLPSINDIESANVDVKTKIIASLAIKALNGNLRATQTLFTLTGDYTTRQEAKIEVDSDLRDLDNAEYKIKIKPGGAEHQLIYHDANGDITKIIYGEEAQRLGALKDEWKEDLHVRVISGDDEEDVHSIIIPDMQMSKQDYHP